MIGLEELVDIIKQKPKSFLKSKAIKSLVLERYYHYDKFANESSTKVVLKVKNYIVEVIRFSSYDYVLIFVHGFKGVENLNDLQYREPDLTIELEFENKELIAEIWHFWNKNIRTEFDTDFETNGTNK